MDSGNSGSVQSSSGGDQEALSIPQQPAVSLSNSTAVQPTLFDPFSHSYNLNDLVWPNYQNTLQVQTSSPLLAPTTGLFTGSAGLDSHEPDTRPEQHAAVPGVVKNSRKRTRASRRALTTVLTTDTSNFRQMVQEFTGIPAPPFSAAATSSIPYGRRLDLFSGGSLGQFYPFRPSAQKVTTPTALENTGITAPVASNNMFPNLYNQLLPNSTNLGGYTNNLQSQLLSREALVFGSSKSQGESLGEMGFAQGQISANLSSFLSEGKGIGRENSVGGVQDNNAISTRNEEGGLNSWNYGQDLSR